MKTIVIISPDYLTAVYEESKKYSFVIQGYGSFKQAINGLLKVNDSELMGVGYIGYTLPLIDSNERRDMESFLQMCNLFENRKRMVFITQTVATELNLLAKKYENVELVKYDNESEITDLLINQSLFGTIMYATMIPYKLNPIKEDNFEYEITELRKGRSAIFDYDCEQLLKKIEKMTTVEETLENDKVFLYYSENKNKLFQTVRKYQVLKLFGKLNIVAQKNLEELVNSTVKNPEQWCFLKTLIERGL